VEFFSGIQKWFNIQNPKNFTLLQNKGENAIIFMAEDKDKIQQSFIIKKKKEDWRCGLRGRSACIASVKP
jgi:hypothetical protein